ncbi:Ubiquitin-related modifier 1 [Leucoagaricus sp. SymC.cos]|nr:Ubiquitin-related modifier 1 [Leucoagaricus sp. SymC.cos]
MSLEPLSLKIEFSGGLELLFSNQRSHNITIPRTVRRDNSTSLLPLEDGIETKPADITYLIHYLRDHLLKERPELFIENQTVRPGILVLVNDTDWELEGEGDYELKSGDEIVFISTLHGG